ncbi:hypothetical protein [Algoriphagus namhaensis]
MKKYFIFFITIAICSCYSKSKESVEKQIQEKPLKVSFDKIDSIKVDFLGNPNVHDIHPESRTVLFVHNYSMFSEDIHLADFEGLVFSSFSKTGDYPDTYSSLLSTLRIVDGYSFLATGYNGFMTYNFDGRLISQVKHIDFQVPNYSPLLMGHGMEKMGDKYVYINQDSPKDNDYSNKSRYDEMYLLDLLDPATGEREGIIKFPESSIFKSGKYFYRNAWDPVFHIENKKIHVAFGLEPVIYTFKASPPYELESTLPIDLKDYNYFKGADEYSEDVSFFGLRFTSGMILNIKKFQDFFLVAYFPGYDQLDTQTNFENKSQDEAKDFRERMQKKYPSRIAIVDSSGNILNDFVPQGLEPSSMLLRDEQLWMMEKPDEEVERDYFRLFRVGLKVDSN